MNDQPCDLYIQDRSTERYLKVIDIVVLSIFLFHSIGPILFSIKES